MQTATMGPIQLTLITYVICTIISLCVAGIITLIFTIIKMKQRRTASQTAAATEKPPSK